MHNQGMMHRDVKVENILLDVRGNTVKLCDWGFAQSLPSSFTKTIGYYGTADYAPPELIEIPPKSDKSTDCWGLGLLIAEIAFDYIPSKTKADGTQDLEPDIENIKSRNLAFSKLDDALKTQQLLKLIKTPSVLDEKLIELVIHLTRFDGSQRLSIHATLSRLESMLEHIPFEQKGLRANTHADSPTHIRSVSLPSSLTVTKINSSQSNDKKHSRDAD